MKLDWSKIEKELDFEESLYNATTESITEFISLNQTQETFYAFAFDYGIDHNHFGLCFNTIEHYNNLISNNGKVNSDEAFELKFNTGNWKYQFFNSENFPTVKNIWNLIVGEKIAHLYKTFEEIELNESLSEETITKTIEYLSNDYENSLKNVIQRIKNNINFTGLKKVDDFNIYYIEFYDGILDIRDRIMN
ncbi:DUF4303 domain-containing protein [uncultured Maribacter sp.]|uniref:DUF4303 domain-containing protein n=1 Tax=uncultured Maribacter sp. TaxID=431308 RepID=UPI00262AC031|nr:DUF4303 domain-containing protein [uncultured Maribacter sp.]